MTDMPCNIFKIIKIIFWWTDHFQCFWVFNKSCERYYCNEKCDGGEKNYIIKATIAPILYLDSTFWFECESFKFYLLTLKNTTSIYHIKHIIYKIQNLQKYWCDRNEVEAVYEKSNKTLWNNKILMCTYGSCFKIFSETIKRIHKNS